MIYAIDDIFRTGTVDSAPHEPPRSPSHHPRVFTHRPLCAPASRSEWWVPRILSLSCHHPRGASSAPRPAHRGEGHLRLVGPRHASCPPEGRTRSRRRPPAQGVPAGTRGRVPDRAARGRGSRGRAGQRGAGGPGDSDGSESRDPESAAGVKPGPATLPPHGRPALSPGARSGSGALTSLPPTARPGPVASPHPPTGRPAQAHPAAAHGGALTSLPPPPPRGLPPTARPSPVASPRPAAAGTPRCRTRRSPEPWPERRAAGPRTHRLRRQAGGPSGPGG